MTSSFDWDAFLAASTITGTTDLDDDQRWSTWPETARTLDRGPQPHPDWVVQHAGAIDTELGSLKSGKEADAHLIHRGLPPEHRTGDPGEETLLVAKRYRTAQHVGAGRGAAYLEGRRTRETRAQRAIAKGTAFGREAAAARWARLEFDTLCRLHTAGLPVPYPVQIHGTELLMEFIGVDAEGGILAAPRLHTQHADETTLRRWAEQLREAVLGFAGLGLVHGDLSPYNVLVDNRDGGQGDLVVIDVPQTLDLVANPNGRDFLRRDCENLCTWLRGQGCPPELADADRWFDDARAAAPGGAPPA